MDAALEDAGTVRQSDAGARDIQVDASYEIDPTSEVDATAVPPTHESEADAAAGLAPAPVPSPSELDMPTDAGGPHPDSVGDADVCVSQEGGCEELTSCSAANASAQCAPCPAGYVEAPDGCTPRLRELGLSYGILNPAFNADELRYDIQVPAYVSMLEITPLLPPGASLDAPGTGAEGDGSLLLVRLVLGASSVVLRVGAPGLPSSEYVINVTRGRPTVHLSTSNHEANDNTDVVAVSADGSTLAVGAWGEASDSTIIGGNQDNNDASQAGAVYVFQRSGEAWSQQAYIKAFNADSRDHFGRALALSADGSTLAVGAPGESSGLGGVGGQGFDDSAEGAGAAYVFRRSGNFWSQEAYLKGANPRADDAFGSSLALSDDGKTLVVGSAAQFGVVTGEGDGADETQTVHSFFQEDDAGWQAGGPLAAYNTKVALSGDGQTLAVGAEGYPDPAGVVRVFSREGADWSPLAEIHASNAESGDRFGASLALSHTGDVLAVGALLEASGATGINGDGSDNDRPYAGAAYVFERVSGGYREEAYLKASNADYYEYFGGQVDLSASGDLLVVGADSEASSASGVDGDQNDNQAPYSGAVYSFVRGSAGWAQHSYLKATSGVGGGFFGRSVSLTADGSVLAVGSTDAEIHVFW